MEHTGYQQRTLPDWEGAHLFLELVRRGSFRSAAENLNMTVNSLRRRVGGFERRLGMVLFTRHSDGVRLTNEGIAMLPAAERMEAASFDFVRAWDQAALLNGEVRLAVTEGLGAFWIAPRLIEFQNAYPKLLVDLRCAMHPADVMRMESDIAIQIVRPEGQNLRMVKIGRLHAIPFASRSYIDTYGAPSSLEELRKHRIVLQVTDQIAHEENFNRLFPGLSQVGLVTIRSNMSSAHFWAIAHGAGIGMLPSYASYLVNNLVPIDIPYSVSQDIWLTYHPDVNKIDRVRRLIDWMIDAFSPRTFPWFRDELVRPNEMPEVVRDMPIHSWFEGFTVGAPGPVHPPSNLRLIGAKPNS